MDHNAHTGQRHDGHAHRSRDSDPAELRSEKPVTPNAHSVGQNLNWISFTATVHCLIGCAIGEVLGMVIGTAIGLDNVATTVLAVTLAFVFGYLLTMLPLLRSGMSRAAAVRLALAADTASITLMEIIDNAIMWAIPGAMDAGLDTLLFWASLTVALLLAGVAAWPLNRWLIARGRGHAVVHTQHSH
ncbi:MAG: DUF4396 domain-containing protein [Burkholderiaceae bacterium]